MNFLQVVSFSLVLKNQLCTLHITLQLECTNIKQKRNFKGKQIYLSCQLMHNSMKQQCDCRPISPTSRFQQLHKKTQCQSNVEQGTIVIFFRASLFRCFGQKEPFQNTYAGPILWFIGAVVFVGSINLGQDEGNFCNFLLFPPPCLSRDGLGCFKGALLNTYVFCMVCVGSYCTCVCQVTDLSK